MKKHFFHVGGGAAKTHEQVAFLQKKYLTFQTDEIHSIFESVLHVKVQSITKPFVDGLPHVTYLVNTTDSKEYCFRANIGTDKPEVELLMEKLTSDLVRKNGVPTNTILYVDYSRKNYPFDFQIQEKLFGENLEYNFKGNQQDYDKLSFELGKIIAKLSNIELPDFGRFSEVELKHNKLQGVVKSNYDYIITELESQLDYIVNSGYLTPNQSKEILNLFYKSKDMINISSGSLVHDDLADHNIFYDPKTFKITGIFDWEAACTSDPMLDIGSSPTWKTLYPREELLINGFSSIKKLPENYREKIELYRLRTVIWKIVHNIKFDILNAERLKRFHNALSPFKI